MNAKRRAFTLVELMVAMGIGALLATLATTGYYAAQRSMADRGAVQAVTSFLRMAAARALVDNVPIVVYVSNKTVSEELVDGTQDAKVRGALVAVRMAGRITCVEGQKIADEFADWEASYSYPDDEMQDKNQTMKVYRMLYKQGLSQSRSYVPPYVTPLKYGGDEDMIASGLTVDSNAKQAQTITFKDGKKEFDCVFRPPPPYGFEVIGGNATWNVGDAYGFEIGQLELPDNYLFSTTYNTTVGEKDTGTQLYFLPGQTGKGTMLNTGLAEMDGNVTVYAIRPGKPAPQAIGKVGNGDLKD